MEQDHQFKGSPYHRHLDIESGVESSDGGLSDDEVASSPFGLASTKNAPFERLQQWRVFLFYNFTVD